MNCWYLVLLLIFIWTCAVGTSTSKPVTVSASIKLFKCNETCSNSEQCRSHIKINDKMDILTEPGIQFVVFSDSTGEQVYKVIFNFLSNNHNRQRLKDFFKAIPPSSIVIVTVNEKCKADIDQWYDLTRLHSNLSLLNTNSDDQEPSIIVTCQNKCRKHIIAETPLPLYRFADYGNPIQEHIKLKLGNPNDWRTNEAGHGEKAPENHQLFIIVLVVSITGVVIVFLLIMTMIYCCKKRAAKRKIERNCDTMSNSRRVQWKFDNWMRQREIEGINRTIAKTNSNVPPASTISIRKEPIVEKKAFRGDIVRCSISTPSMVDFRHEFSYDNVFDADDGASISASTKITTMSRTSDDNVSNTATIFTSCDNKDAGGYLTPIDARRNYYRPSLTRMESEPYNSTTWGSNFSSISRRYSTANIYVREIPPLPDHKWFSPSTSRRIFLSTSEEGNIQSDVISMRESVDGMSEKECFAEYCKIDVNGPIYKRPSDVLRFDPPEYNPFEVPKKIPRADSFDDGGQIHYATPSVDKVLLTDDERYKKFKEEGGLSTTVPCYEVATKV